MKANELMIGDWVKTNQCYSRIAELRGVEGIKLEDKFGYGFTPEVEPIPLTAEILEKNGFEVQDQGGGRKDVWTGFGIDYEGDIEVEFQNNIPVHLKINGGFKGEYYTSTNIKYVHQLQHALRLCGIEKEIVL